MSEQNPDSRCHSNLHKRGCDFIHKHVRFIYMKIEFLLVSAYEIQWTSDAIIS